MRYRYLFGATALITIGCPQLAYANCTFRYDTEVAEVTGEAKLGLAVKAAQDVANQLESALGVTPAPKNFSLKGNYSITAAGGLAESAYSETAKAFFACVRQNIKADPAKVQALDAAEKKLVLQLNRYFDIGRWQPANIEARDSIRDELEAETRGTPIFDSTEIDKFLPKPNFDTIKIVSAMGDLAVPGFNLTGCGGIVTRSIKKVDPSILDALGTVRATVLTFLSGDQSSASIDLWIFASTQMSSQMTAGQIGESGTVNPALVTCVQNQVKVLQDAAAKNKAPVPVVTATDAN